MTGGYEDRPFLECLCTNLDIWAIGLRSAGGSAQLVTTYPALPRGTDRVDIVLPGTANLTGLAVTRRHRTAPPGSARPGRAAVARWTYDERRPPAGLGAPTSGRRRSPIAPSWPTTTGWSTG